VIETLPGLAWSRREYWPFLALVWSRLDSSSLLGHLETACLFIQSQRGAWPGGAQFAAAKVSSLGSVSTDKNSVLDHPWPSRPSLPSSPRMSAPRTGWTRWRRRGRGAATGSGWGAAAAGGLTSPSRSHSRGPGGASGCAGPGGRRRERGRRRIRGRRIRWEKWQEMDTEKDEDENGPLLCRAGWPAPCSSA
jgi:hypothetical protein